MPLIEPFSFQLYSAREFPPIREQIRTVTELGFRSIEPYRDLYEDPEETRAYLDEFGVVARSGHFAIDGLEADFARYARAAHILGIGIMIAPSLRPELRPVDRLGWQEFGARLEVLRNKAEAEGFRFAWHNHDFEFKPLPDGSYPIEHLLGDTIAWQADIAWVARSGQDPLLWLKKYGGRVIAMHIKDIAPEGEKQDELGWADVGTGILPWEVYWQAGIDAGAEIAVAEHDKPSDYKRFAKNSFSVISGLLNGGK